MCHLLTLGVCVCVCVCVCACVRVCLPGQEKVISMGKQSVFNMTFADRKQGRPLFANVSRGHKYYMAQVSTQPTSSGLFLWGLHCDCKYCVKREEKRICLWGSWCTLCLLPFQTGVTLGDSGLCCYVCVTSFKR